jgi:hypothetical protein
MFVQTLLVLEAAERHARERGQGGGGARFVSLPTFMSHLSFIFPPGNAA